MASDSNNDLQRFRTAESVIITPELFEKLYLSPESKVKGQLRSTLANPTPLALAGFTLALTPLSIDFMGWRGSNTNGIALQGSLYFQGGMLAILGAVGEFLLGNSFSLMVFGVYGAFFIGYAATLTPDYGTYSAFATDPAQPLTGAMSEPFLSATAFWALFMGLFSIYAAICALRVNAIFVFNFTGLVFAFLFFAASNWYGAQGDMDTLHEYKVIAGAFAFAVSMTSWYLLFALALTTVDFPLNLPVGDLSTVFKGASERAKAKKNAQMQNGDSESKV